MFFFGKQILLGMNENDRDALLLSLANDFKRYFFNQWRYELSQQRLNIDENSPQILLTNGKINAAVGPLYLHCKQLQDQIKLCEQTQATFCDCLNTILNRLDNIDSRLQQVEKKLKK